MTLFRPHRTVSTDIASDGPTIVRPCKPLRMSGRSPFSRPCISKGFTSACASIARGEMRSTPISTADCSEVLALDDVEMRDPRLELEQVVRVEVVIFGL